MVFHVLNRDVGGPGKRVRFAYWRAVVVVGHGKRPRKAGQVRLLPRKAGPGKRDRFAYWRAVVVVMGFRDAQIG